MLTEVQSQKESEERSSASGVSRAAMMNAPATVLASVGNCETDWHPIHFLREAAGLNRSDLAELAGVSFGSLVLYERGKAKPGIDVAFRLAHILGVTVDKLFGIPYKMQAREDCDAVADR